MIPRSTRRCLSSGTDTRDFGMSQKQTLASSGGLLICLQRFGCLRCARGTANCATHFHAMEVKNT